MVGRRIEKLDQLRKIAKPRVDLQYVNYRMLYFFHGREAAVVSHGLVKPAEVPPKEIEKAIQRKQKFEKNPKAHTHEEE